MNISITLRLWEPRAGQRNSLIGSSYSFFFGGTSSGKTVNKRTAMQTTTVYFCVRILLERIASLPRHTFKHTESGKEKATEHSIYHLLAE